MGPPSPATGESDATTPSLATSNPPPEVSHHPDTPALPPDWAHLTSSLISDCLCLTWLDTPDTRQALTHMLDAGQSDLKARAASGLRAPKRHGTLHITEAADYQVLTQHCVLLGLLPSPPPTHVDDPHWDAVGSLTPPTLHQYRDEALPYTCFVEPTDPIPGPPPNLLLLLLR